MKIAIEQPGPGQESVWSFPRPAVAEPCPHHLQVVHGGIEIASTRRGVRTLETSHPPTYYVPIEDVVHGVLEPSGHRSLCEWKGQAVYFDVVIAGERRTNAAWSYPRPTPAFAAIAGHVAFYAAAFDRCLIDGEVATPQPGGFYGGWVSSHVSGPFKGVPGSRFW